MQFLKKLVLLSAPLALCSRKRRMSKPFDMSMNVQVEDSEFTNTLTSEEMEVLNGINSKPISKDVLVDHSVHREVIEDEKEQIENDYITEISLDGVELPSSVKPPVNVSSYESSFTEEELISDELFTVESEAREEQSEDEGEAMKEQANNREIADAHASQEPECAILTSTLLADPNEDILN